MSIERSREVLNSLNSEYRAIIYWQEEGLNDKDIGGKIGLSANAVYQRKKQLELAFDVSGVDYPSPDVYLALTRYFQGPPRFEPKEEPVEQVVDVPPSEPPVPDPIPPAPPQPSGRIIDPPPAEDGEHIPPPGIVPTEQRTRREGCLSLPVLLGALLLVVTGLLIWSVLTDENQPVDRIVEVTREIESIVEVTVPPIEVTRVVELINTVEVPVVQTMVQTVVVEVPVTVEVTPLPPTPTPLPQTVTITEDFDDGEIDPSIRTLNSPIIVNGVLEPPNTLTIGDETWRNYSIAFDWFPLSCGYSGGNNGSLRLRESAVAHILYQMPYCANDDKTWYVVTGGQQYEALVVRSGSPIRVLVEDDQITQTTPDGQTHQFINTNADSGGISLNLNYAQVDNLVITRND